MSARCESVTREPGGKYRHLLRRKTVGRESKRVLLRTGKNARLRVGDEVYISYDPAPANAHLVYVGKSYPRFTHGRAVLLFLALGLACWFFAALA
ncbi:hypothetical protein GCM10010388_72700 [Streptomyces mauvecolor]